MISLKIFPYITLIILIMLLLTDSTTAQETPADSTIKNLMELQFKAWSSHDPDLIDEVFAEDGVYEDAAVDFKTEGREKIKNLMRGTFSAIPDFKVELMQWFSSNNNLACQWVMTGTQTGDFPNFPASGNSFSVRGASIAVMENGKFISWTDYYDMYSFLSQLGAIPDQNSGDEN